MLIHALVFTGGGTPHSRKKIRVGAGVPCFAVELSQLQPVGAVFTGSVACRTTTLA